MVSIYITVLVNITVCEKNTYAFALFIAAAPKTPFPLIKECNHGIGRQNEGHNCSFATDSAVNVTCSVSDYFPSITLYFRHELAKVEARESEETNNVDGTKNKSVTIIAVPDDDPYVCVASDIPGSVEHEKYASILLFPLSPSSTSIYAVTQSTESSDGGGGPDLIGELISEGLQINQSYDTWEVEYYIYLG